MSEHIVTVSWTNRAGADFLKRKYSREHSWIFDGGTVVAASSSPSVVPVPYSNPVCVDPEEAFIASVSSCHMLWFLSLAADADLLVESYRDEAVGVMSKNENGTLWISEITLRPLILYGERQPAGEEERRLHHESHERCFIANSIKTAVRVAASR
jgi:organic hydroperoxide reductase OsmC/OhrA